MDLAMEHSKEQTIQNAQNRLLQFIKGKVGTMEDAEDILQDVLLQFIDGYGTVRSIEQATSWLFKVARNRIIDQYRKQSARPKPLGLGQAQTSGGSPLMLVDILPDFGGSPEEAYFKSVVWKAINEALDLLPDAQREVFVLQEINGMGFREISERTGVSVNTLISRKRYAVIALRKRLQALYNDI